MLLSDYVDVQALLDAVTNQSPFNTIETAVIVARNIAASMAEEKIAASVEPDIQDLYDMHVMTHGEFPKGARTFQVEGWLEPLEDQISTYFDNRAENLSASWLGVVDNKTPRDQAGVQKLAQEYAKEVYKNLTYLHDKENGREKTAAQVLSSVGIVREDLMHLVDATRNKQTFQQPEKVEPMAPVYYNELIAELHGTSQVLGLSGKALYDTVDNASDDPVLAASALSALMIVGRPEVNVALVTLRKSIGLDALFKLVAEGGTVTPVQSATQSDADAMAAMMGGAAPSETDALAAMMGGAAPAPAPAPTATASKRGNKAAAATVSEASVIPGALLASLRDATGMKSEDLGAVIGTSRATFDNYCKGKGKLFASADVKSSLLEIVAAREETLHELYKQLDAL